MPTPSVRSVCRAIIPLPLRHFAAPTVRRVNGVRSETGSVPGEEIEFADDERAALTELRGQLRQVAEWPPESPLSFVLLLAPRTRGKLGELLLSQIAAKAGLRAKPSGAAAFDVWIGNQRCEVKFSTEDPPRFQQVRDPRLDGDETKYDYLVCISGRAHGLVYWLIPAAAVGELMDGGYITVQHAMSDTKWFLPSRLDSDTFAAFRYTYEDFVEALRSASVD
jgi:hypothetical protein